MEAMIKDDVQGISHAALRDFDSRTLITFFNDNNIDVECKKDNARGLACYVIEPEFFEVLFEKNEIPDRRKRRFVKTAVDFIRRYEQIGSLERRAQEIVFRNVLIELLHNYSVGNAPIEGVFIEQNKESCYAISQGKRIPISLTKSEKSDEWFCWQGFFKKSVNSESLNRVCLVTTTHPLDYPSVYPISDKRVLTAYGTRGQLILSRAQSQKVIETKPFSTCMLSGDRQYAIMGHDNGEITIVHLYNNALVHTFKAGDCPITSLDLSSDNQLLVAGMQDGKLYAFNCQPLVAIAQLGRKIQKEQACADASSARILGHVALCYGKHNLGDGLFSLKNPLLQKMLEKRYKKRVHQVSVSKRSKGKKRI